MDENVAEELSVIRVPHSETRRITSTDLLRSYSLSEPTPELKDFY
jgi:hypothetical protein